MYRMFKVGYRVNDKEGYDYKNFNFGASLGFNINIYNGRLDCKREYDDCKSIVVCNSKNINDISMFIKNINITYEILDFEKHFGDHGYKLLVDMPSYKLINIFEKVIKKYKYGLYHKLSKKSFCDQIFKDKRNIDYKFYISNDTNYRFYIDENIYHNSFYIINTSLTQLKDIANKTYLYCTSKNVFNNEILELLKKINISYTVLTMDEVCEDMIVWRVLVDCECDNLIKEIDKFYKIQDI